jgi:1,4-dihydroxy-2-naphthoate octaprenyltransferase
VATRTSSSTKRRPPARPQGRSSTRNRRPPQRRARPADWIAGARPRTLPLAIAPVALGAGAALDGGPVRQPWLALLCLAVSLLLQIGVNFANDYSDGVRGTDRHRVGPARLTASGLAKPRTVLAVALACFALAAVAGLVVVVVTQLWWLLAVGAAAIAAAWFYTGGRRPYGYAGLGEIAVFLFFGLAATCGTTYVMLGTVTDRSILAAVAIGCIACAVLLVNNLRDIDQDRAAGKRTLSVRIGARATRVLYAVLMLVPYAVLLLLAFVFPLAPLVFLTLLAAAPAILITATARTPRELVLALSLTGLTALLYGLGLAAAFAF